jgi:predicted acylesterase/phospholipase RssA
MSALRNACLLTASLLAAGCTTLNSYTNEPLPVKPPPSGRASLAVTAERGNPKVLVMLALSGGGSRAAYFSAAVMLKLQKIFPERDLLREVDVLSSVSGGSMAAAYYAISRDARIYDGALAALVAPPPPGEPVAPAKLRREADGTLSCAAALDGAEEASLRVRLGDALRARDPDYAARRVLDLCRQANVASNRVWDEPTVKNLMSNDYIQRWIGNWFWPWNAVNYWFTAFDRSDLMAQTFADSLYDVAVTGRDLTFAELNPERPYLIVNSTNATGGYSAGAGGDGFPFGSVFTFTTEDFRERIGSDLSTYSVARAVMASASFPVVFPSMTLRDYRPQPDKYNRYVHVFDGGNSDNLGLATFRRVLLEAALDGRIANYDRVVVISIDAFTRPAGAPSVNADSRGDFFSYFLDTNLSSAIDSLLQANRASSLDQFRNRAFTWKECDTEPRSYPKRLCDAIDKLGGSLDERLALEKRLVFYHIGFDDAGDAQIGDFDKDGNPVKIRLIERLDRIPTSLKMSGPDRDAIDTAVELIVNERNDCLRAIRDIVMDKRTTAKREHETCQDAEPELKPGARK